MPHRVAAALSAVLFLLLAPSLGADRNAAIRLVAEGDALYQRRDFDGAIAAYTRAIEADPEYGTAWGRRGVAKRIATRFDAALEDLTNAIALDPGTAEWRLQRIQNYMSLDRTQEAVEDSADLLRVAPNDPSALTLHGWALVKSGEVDQGLELQTRALQLAGNNANLRIRAEAFMLKADWNALLEEMDQALAGGNPNLGIHYNRTMALVELGRWDDAAQAVKLAESKSRGTVLYMSRVYLTATPQAGAHHAPDQALKDAESAGGTTTESLVLNGYARALFLTGHVHRCMELLAAKGRRTNFETLFWLGASYWKLGRLAEARQALSDARRLNPYLLKHAARVDGLAEFAAAIDHTLAREAEGGADRERLGHERATHLLTVAEIETLVRAYRFDRAAAEYASLVGELASSVRKAEAEARRAEILGMAKAHARLIAAANASGGTPLKTKVGKLDLTIQKATGTDFEFTLPGGSGSFPWKSLQTAAYCALAEKTPLAPEERLGLGCLAWEAGDRALAIRLLEEAVKKAPALKQARDGFVARQRGVPVPAAGFVAYKASYVTPAEKANLEKGLVAWQGQWVTAKDKEMLAKGMVQVAGKWMPGEDADLLRRGFVKYKGKWVSREEYDDLRSGWADAFTEETAHYRIKTNQSEAFAKDLAVLAEVAYGEFKTYYGGAEPKLPGSEKMTLWAFKAFEDYRRHCVETKAEDHLNAAGFARSDSNVVVGWNKTMNERQFLETMVHEAAHLYYYRVAGSARPASWFAEAMATYFEGFAWDGKSYRFSFVSESRLPFVRDAMKRGQHIPLAEMLGGDALTLINSDPSKALLFYAQCWALNYFLSQTDRREYRAAYEEYRRSIDRGGTDPLAKFIPDLARLEKDWVRFVGGL